MYSMDGTGEINGSCITTQVQCHNSGGQIDILTDMTPLKLRFRYMLPLGEQNTPKTIAFQLNIPKTELI